MAHWPGDHLNRITPSMLKMERGWTEGLIRELLGKPDWILPHPVYRSRMQLYDLNRVEKAELSQVFLASKRSKYSDWDDPWERYQWKLARQARKEWYDRAIKRQRVRAKESLERHLEKMRQNGAVVQARLKNTLTLNSHLLNGEAEPPSPLLDYEAWVEWHHDRAVDRHNEENAALERDMGLNI